MSVKKINILVCPSDRAGVGYFRSTSPHIFMKAMFDDEVNVDICYDLGIMNNFAEFIKGYDIIHFHKALDPNAVIVNEAKKMGIITIGDVDDNWDLGNYHPMSLAAKVENWKEPILKNLRAADYVTTTTPLFAKRVRQVVNKNVEVVPNALNPYEPQFRPAPSSPHKRLRIGLICGSSHLHDIELLSSIATKLDNETLDKIQIVLCGFDTRGNTIYTNPETKERTVKPIKPSESVWCKYESILTNDYQIIKDPNYVAYLKQYMQMEDYPNVSDQPYRRIWNKPISEYATLYNDIDVLLAPLLPCDFNLVKSQLKVIEAGWFGKAIIASNFGPYTLDLTNFFDKNGNINPLGNGLLVDSGKDHKQWVKYIKRLADNPEYVSKMGFNLFTTVRHTYDIETVTSKRFKFYKKIYDERHQ